MYYTCTCTFISGITKNFLLHVFILCIKYYYTADKGDYITTKIFCYSKPLLIGENKYKTMNITLPDHSVTFVFYFKIASYHRRRVWCYSCSSVYWSTCCITSSRCISITSRGTYNTCVCVCVLLLYVSVVCVKLVVWCLLFLYRYRHLRQCFPSKY